MTDAPLSAGLVALAERIELWPIDRLRPYERRLKRWYRFRAQSRARGAGPVRAARGPRRRGRGHRHRSQVRPASAEPAQPAIDTAAIYAARNQNVR